MKKLYFLLLTIALLSCTKEMKDPDYSGNGIYTDSKLDQSTCENKGDITVMSSGTTWTLDTMTSAIIIDSDCDGVPDNLDKCPGINDKIDNDHDGNPDCFDPPIYSKVLPAWKCGPQKAFVCFKTNSGSTVTICTYYSAINTHIANGNRLGICGSSKCGN